MRRTEILLALGGLPVGLLLTACVAPPEITPAAPPPTPAVVAGAAAGVSEAPPVLAAARFPLPPPVYEEVMQADSTNCVTCHTDQEDLQALAEEPEEEEHLSEGEG